MFEMHTQITRQMRTAALCARSDPSSMECWSRSLKGLHEMDTQEYASAAIDEVLL